MDIRYINSFITGLLHISNMLGMHNMQRTGLGKKEKLVTDNDVNVILGLTGDTKGTVVVSMPEKTACNIASVMMGGMAVESFDYMPKSALCEMANMVVGHTLVQLEKTGLMLTITPPVLISGRNLISMINQVETISIQFSSAEGNIEMNVALEE
jgi:chemotaxis protein CheX